MAHSEQEQWKEILRTRHKPNLKLHSASAPTPPWKVNDAPASYVAALSKAIAGIEIHIHSLAGKHKMSQELNEGDREGVVSGFEALGTEMGDVIARKVKEKGEKREKNDLNEDVRE